MYSTTTQRWRERRDSYRPAGETIDVRRFEVASIPDDNTAKRFVVEHHYSASFPAARYRFGLFKADELVGVAVFSVPPHPKVITNCLPGDASESVELGRFVLLDSVPGNGETWFLARCFEALRAEAVVGVVSFSDPSPRSTLDGRQIFAGHIGTIYQAHNATYIGRGASRTLKLLPDGTVLSARALSKLRTGERGWRYTAELLEHHGAELLEAGADRRAWAAHWTGQLTRNVRHPGNHKYVWALDKRARRHLPPSQPYPKMAA
jgi:hypothetical protein